MARAEYGRYNPSHFLARRSRTTVRRAPGIFLQTADRRRAPPPTHYSIGKIRLTQRMYVSCASSPLDLRQLVRFDVAMKQLRQRRIERDALKHTVDRKSTRLNSSHVAISYAVFCLKKKMNISEACKT